MREDAFLVGVGRRDGEQKAVFSVTLVDVSSNVGAVFGFPLPMPLPPLAIGSLTPGALVTHTVLTGYAQEANQLGRRDGDTIATRVDGAI
jgi:hypothetical protein